jgi:hypothetical protein
MAGVIFTQPNGLYCRISTVVDCPTNWNMTEEEYIAMCAHRCNRDEAKRILRNHTQPFTLIRDYFCTNNMTEEEFENILKKMEIPIDQLTEEDKEIY